MDYNQPPWQQEQPQAVEETPKPQDQPGLGQSHNAWRRPLRIEGGGE